MDFLDKHERIWNNYILNLWTFACESNIRLQYRSNDPHLFITSYSVLLNSFSHELLCRLWRRIGMDDRRITAAVRVYTKFYESWEQVFFLLILLVCITLDSVELSFESFSILFIWRSARNFFIQLNKVFIWTKDMYVCFQWKLSEWGDDDYFDDVRLNISRTS